MVTALSGCSASYNGERLLWKAQRLAGQELARSDGVAGSAQLTQVVEAFTRVIQKAPGTVWAARAQLSIASLYARERQYPRALEAFEVVLRNYSHYRDRCLEARVGIAKLYELEEKWDEAIEAYGDLADFAPWTLAGLEAPLYIGVLSMRRGQIQQGSTAFEQAVARYSELVNDAPNPEAAVKVKAYLALTYQHLGRWERAVAVLEELLEAPSGINRPLILLTLGTLYETKIGSPDRAGGLYSTLAQEFPEHPLGKAAKMKLEHLGIALAPVPPVTATPPVPTP